MRKIGSNNIIWGNSGGDIYIGGDGSNVRLYNNNYGSITGTPAFSLGHINENPLFVDEVDDYHLKIESPCINAGTNEAPGLPSNDKDGNTRILNGTVDMGAYENNIDTIPPETTASPTGGTYPFLQTVTLCCIDSGSGCGSTYYTINGTVPTISSPIYSGAIAISGNTTLKFFSVDNAGNSESVKTETYVISTDTTPPTTTVWPAGGTYSSERTVTLSCSDSVSGCGSTYYTTDGTVPTISSPIYSSAIVISGNTTLMFFSVDNAGNSESVNIEIYVIDATAPTGSIVIENAASFTKSTTVILTLSATDDSGIVASMRFISTDGLDLKWSDWEAYGTSKEWTLMTGDGEKIVYVQYRDGEGRESGSYKDTILLDTAAPSVTITGPANGSSPTEILSIKGTASDAVSVVVAVEIQVTDGLLYLTQDQRFSSTPAWLTVSATDQWTHSTNDVDWKADYEYTVFARATDAAGNVSTVVTSIFDYFVAGKEYTTLSVDVSGRSILAGTPINASGKLTHLPEDGTDLSGIPITLIVKKEPDGLESTFDTTTGGPEGNDSLNNITGFDNRGQYSVRAKFAGTDSLYGIESEAVNVHVGTAGYAVIVQGKISSEKGVKSHNKTTNRVYNTLKKRGFLDDEIYYFNYDVSQVGVTVDDVPGKLLIRDAIETWARDKMNSVPAPLYIIMTGHGSAGSFFIHPDTITTADLAAMLNNLESGLIGNAKDGKRVIVYGACFSGSFIPALSGPGRVIVTSAAADEESFKGPAEQDGIRSGEYFLDGLFKELGRGRSLTESFIESTQETELFTRQGGVDLTGFTNRYFDYAAQHPLLDDNNDTVGNNVVPEGTGEGLASFDIYLGTGDSYVPGDPNNPAEFKEVTGTLYLDTSTSTATLWAIANDDVKVERAWAEIRFPSDRLYALGGTLQLENKVSRVEMALIGSRWEAAYSSFTESGKYEAFYFAEDKDTHEISPIERSIVYKNKTGNKSPEGFSLLLPEDGAVKKTALIFDWEDSNDPDSDVVTYNLVIAEDNAFTTEAHREEGIKRSMTYAAKEAVLKDLTTYYWKVEAVDSYGGRRTSTETWAFFTNNTNSFTAIIEGNVYNKNDWTMIKDTKVKDDEGFSYITDAYGDYILEVSPGSRTITTTHSSFQSSPVPVIMSPGGYTILDIGMTPSASLTPGIFTNDTVYVTNKMLTLSVSLVNPGAETTVDVYIALLFPDGSSLLFLKGDLSFQFSSRTDPSGWMPFVSGWTIPSGFNLSGFELFKYQFSGSEPQGNYTWFIGLAKPETLDFVGEIGSASFNFNP